METLKDFTRLYPVSKTLSEELRPVPKEGQTEEQFWDEFTNSVIFYNDIERSEAYPIVKKMLDAFHKKFIEESLASVDIDWNKQFAHYQSRDKNHNELKKEQDAARKYIVKEYFNSHKWWNYISKDHRGLIETVIPNLLQDNMYIDSVLANTNYTKQSLVKAVSKFKRFSMYFDKYFTNRKNMYSDKAQITSIANRIVNQNFIRFAENIEVYVRLKELCPNELLEIENNLRGYLNGRSLDDVFTPNYFNCCINQKGIEHFNWLIGGSPNENILGINSVGNQYLQNHKDSKTKLRDLKMTRLYKQILSDHDRLSFLPEQFSEGDKGEQELMDAIETFHNLITSQNLLGKVEIIMSRLESDNVDLSKIYVVGKSLTELSHLLYGNWDALGYALRTKFVGTKTKTDKESHLKDIEDWISNKAFSLSQIMEVENELKTDNSVNVLELFTHLRIWKKINNGWVNVDLIKQCEDGYTAPFLSIKDIFNNGTKISNNEKFKEGIKFVLDIIHLYNKVRRFLTRKLRDSGKILINFDSATILNGWTNAFIIIHENNYYLSIPNVHNKVTDEELKTIYDIKGKSKLVSYKFQKMDYKNFPRHFIYSKKDNFAPNVEKFNLPINLIIDDYKKYRALDNVRKKEFLDKNKQFRKNLIDYFKFCSPYDESLSPFKDVFNSVWKPTEEYQTLSDFYDDTQKACYDIELKSINYDKLIQLSNQNKLFLFKIYNKDFAPGSSGTKNLHTLYWNALFDERNLSDVRFKLDGQGAELFYRKKANGRPYIHKQGSILVNKTYSDGNPIESKLYEEYMKYFSKQIDESQLTPKAKEKLSLVKTNIAKTNIVKDKRFYDHKLLFHVPITINFKNQGVKDFNAYALQKLRESKEDLNIIGIDRGERNLIYVSVINQRGENVIPPKSFNIIDTESYDRIERHYNYQSKLKQKETERDSARKNWGEIETIKDLKSGYLSLVIHEIAKLMVKYNAIVILENLNYGFKRGRFRVERQVYQNFEKMLINKLNYLVFKKDAPSEEYGNVLNGLQLTDQFKSFKEMGKQSGWLFYVPAAYTSKIDPMTGFTNLFNMKVAQKDPKAFFSKFECIVYKDGLYQFTFDYRKFETVQTDFRNVWTVCSIGERLSVSLDKIIGKHEIKPVDLTTELTKLFEGIEHITLNDILEIKDKKFFDSLFYYFKLVLQMRNSKTAKDAEDEDIDYILSPVCFDNQSMTFFDSRINNSLNILDADANGAYHIALKGLYWLLNNFPTENSGNLSQIHNEDWLRFAQEKPYLNDK